MKSVRARGSCIFRYLFGYRCIDRFNELYSLAIPPLFPELVKRTQPFYLFTDIGTLFRRLLYPVIQLDHPGFQYISQFDRYSFL